MLIIQFLYLATATISIVVLIPQIQKLLAMKRSDELSISAWTVWTLYQLSALAYGISVGASLLIVVSAIAIPLYATVLVLVIKYRNTPVPQLAVEEEKDHAGNPIS